jgi:hypothetical protein
MHFIVWLVVCVAVLLVLALAEPLLYPNARAEYERRRRDRIAASVAAKRQD